MDGNLSGSGGWRFAQCFGGKGEVKDITEGAYCIRLHASSSLHTSPDCVHWDVTLILLCPVFVTNIISTVELNSTGNYLVMGDKGGHVVLFKQNKVASQSSIRNTFTQWQFGSPNALTACAN
jgi:serine/threonine-protein phosphatase 2A regulatory subunit B